MVLNHTSNITSNPLRLQDLQIPVPKTDQALVKIHVCGVCRTDLQVVGSHFVMCILKPLDIHDAADRQIVQAYGLADFRESRYRAV